VLGLGMIIGVRSAQQATWDRSDALQEDHMVRKVEMLAAKAGAVDGEGAVEREGLKLAQDMPLKEQVIFTGSSDWTPDQAEHYIDWRIQCVDTEIARLRCSALPTATATGRPLRRRGRERGRGVGGSARHRPATRSVAGRCVPRSRAASGGCAALGSEA